MSPGSRFVLILLALALGSGAQRSLRAGEPGDPIRVLEGASILSAALSAGEGGIVELHAERFQERLDLRNVARGVTIRAGEGFRPIIAGDVDTNWDDFGPIPGRILAFVDQEANFENLHFQIDLTGLPPADGYQLFRVATSGQYQFTNCTFEFTGFVSLAGRGVVGRHMVRLEGTTHTTFTNCEFKYSTNLIPWPNFLNTVAYFQPGGAAISVTFDGCRFDSVPDVAGLARSIGGSGGGGESFLAINDCEFGVNRSSPLQFQQAYISPAVRGTRTVVRNSVFSAGANRYFGLQHSLEIQAEGCIFMNPAVRPVVGEIFLPDPGGTTIRSTNCVFFFLSTLGPPFRSGERRDGRHYSFRNCTFNDLSGRTAENAGRAPALLKLRSDSVPPEFRNCIFYVPGFSHHLLQNVDPRGNPPGSPVALNNLIFSAVYPLRERILPDSAFLVTNEDPRLNPEDGFHLLGGSPAIGKGAALGVEVDIDGDDRNVNPGRDIGADEFHFVPVSRPGRQIRVPGDAETLAAAMTMANRNFDEIILESDVPFHETLRGDRLQSAIRVRAGDGFSPMIIADGDTPFLKLDESVLEDGAVSLPATPFVFGVRGSFEGIHFRLDLTDMAVLDPGEDFTAEEVSTRLLFFYGSFDELLFRDCVFEITGNPLPGHEDVFGLRDPVCAEGAPRCVFENCEWRYESDLSAWSAGRNAAFGYRTFEGDLLRATFNGCDFPAVPDTAGAARHIGMSGFSEGEVFLEINDCRFGTDRERFGPRLGEQRQDAHLVVEGSHARCIVDRSTFLGGAMRQLSVGDGREVLVNASVLEAMPFGHGFHPEFDGGRFFVTNSVLRFDSRTFNDSRFVTPVRAETEMPGGGDRVYQFLHCLFQDVAGLAGNPRAGLVTVNDFTGLNKTNRSHFINCIIDMPAANFALVNNFETLDDPLGPVNLAPISGAPGAMRNLLLTDDVLDSGAALWGETAAVCQGRPVFSTDALHLSECSHLAVDVVSRAVLPEFVAVSRPLRVDIDRFLLRDIDGEERPLIVETVSGDADLVFDIGPDEFNGALKSREECGFSSTPLFLRGDHDVSGRVDFSDSIGLMRFLFLGDGAALCLDASDADNSGEADISDAVRILTFLFLGGCLASPGPEICGPDPTEFAPSGCLPNAQPIVSLGCQEFPPCPCP